MWGQQAVAGSYDRNFSLPGELAELLDAELQDGEHVVWLGQPIPERFAKGAGCLVAFGAVWTAATLGGGLFWLIILIIARHSGDGIPTLFFVFPLASVPFALIGVAILLVPRQMRRRAKRTVYALTDQRAILIEAGRSTAVRSFGPESFAGVEVRQNVDGSGDVVFESDAPRDARVYWSSFRGGFVAVPDVREVAELVRQVEGVHQSGGSLEEQQGERTS